MIELWMLCFYLAGLMAAACLAFLLLGALAYVFGDRIERVMGRLVRD